REAGVRREPRRGPLPDLPDALQLPRGRRLLPFELGGQSRTVRAGEGVRLEPGDVDDGRVRVPGLRAGVVGDVVVLLPRPALARPPLAAHVAAALAEVHPRGVGDRVTGDREACDVARVTQALVVVGEDLVGGADHRRAAGYLDELEPVAAGRTRLPVAVGEG